MDAGNDPQPLTEVAPLVSTHTHSSSSSSLCYPAGPSPSSSLCVFCGRAGGFVRCFMVYARERLLTLFVVLIILGAMT